MEKHEYLYAFEKGFIPFWGEYDVLYKNWDGNIGKGTRAYAATMISAIHTALLVFPPTFIGFSTMMGLLNVARKNEIDLESKLKTNNNEVLA